MLYPYFLKANSREDIILIMLDMKFSTFLNQIITTFKFRWLLKIWDSTKLLCFLFETTAWPCEKPGGCCL